MGMSKSMGMGSGNLVMEWEDVCDATKLSVTTILLLMKDKNSGFPLPIKIRARRKIWLAQQVYDWIKKQAERDAT